MVLRNFLIDQGLTNGEIAVVRLVACGLTNDQIADRLCLSVKTIKFHLTKTYRKLGLSTRGQLIVRCAPHTIADQSSDIVKARRELEAGASHAN